MICILVWFQVFLSNTNNMNTVIWFEVLLIGLMAGVFCSCSGDWVQAQVESYQRVSGYIKKVVLPGDDG